MGEKQPRDIYREMAAELRAVAGKLSNWSSRYELLKIADEFDRLADFAEKQIAH